MQEEGHRHNYRERAAADMVLVSAPDCHSYMYGVLTNGPDHNVTWIPGVTWPHNSRVCMDRVVSTANATVKITQEKAKIGGFTKLIRSSNFTSGGIQMEDGTTGASETRPKNMKAVFIMRIV